MSLKIWSGLAAITILGLLWLSAPAIAGPYYLAQGRRALAETDAPAAIDRLAAAAYWQPERVEIQRQLAQAYLQAGQPEEALAAAQEALRLAPDAPESHLTLGDVYDHLDQPEQAVAHYEAGQIGDRAIPLTVNYLRLAGELWTEGRHEESAVIWRDKVRSLGYGSLYANWRLATYYRMEGDSSSFEARVSLYVSPDDVEQALAQPRLEPYAKEAVAGLITDGLWTREKLLHMLVYLAQRQPNDAAEALIQHLLTIHPNDPDLHYYLGDVYYLRGNRDEAAAAYQQAVRLEPTDENGYLRLGLLAEENQDDDEAARWYSMLLEQIPDAWLAGKKLAETKRRLGRTDEAAQLEQGWLEQVVELGPTVVVSQTLDSSWTFVGYRTDAARLVRGETAPLVLYWQGPGQPGTATNGWFALSDGRWMQVIDEAKSLMANGGFELGPTAFVFRDVPNIQRLESVNTVGRVTTALRLINSEARRRTNIASPRIPVNAKSLYLQAGRVLSEDGNAFLGRYWYGELDKDVTPYNYVAGNLRPQQWQIYAGLAQPLSGATETHIWLLNFETTGQAFFDDNLFVEIDQPAS